MFVVGVPTVPLLLFCLCMTAQLYKYSYSPSIQHLRTHCITRGSPPHCDHRALLQCEYSTQAYATEILKETFVNLMTNDCQFCFPIKFGFFIEHYAVVLEFQLVCLSVCLPATLPFCLSACHPACLSVCMPACISVCLYVSLYACMSVCQSFCLSVCLPVCCLSVCMFVCLSVCLPIQLFCFSSNFCIASKYLTERISIPKNYTAFYCMKPNCQPNCVLSALFISVAAGGISVTYGTWNN